VVQKASVEGRAPLTPQRVVDEAMALLDEEGWDAFGMRALARRLQVKPNALYWHVPDLDTLLAQVAARLLSEMDLPSTELPWQDQLRSVGRSYRDIVVRHPRCAALLTTRLASNWSADFPLVESMLHALQLAGLRNGELVRGYNAVVGALGGFVGVEFSTGPVAAAEWEQRQRSDLAVLDADRFPAMVSVVDELGDALLTRWEQRPLPDSFEWLLDTLVAGTEALAARSRGSAG
jgi:AcrR family transcriptional regulator